jgi:5-methylcytosine-specific restriction endonuclease McrA
MAFPLKALPKPEKRQAVTRKDDRQAKRVTRAQVVAAVWRRDKGHCVRCGKTCVRPKETYPTDPDRGEVNDIVPRSLGGNPRDVSNNELLCHCCHFGAASGAHAPTAARMVTDRKKRGMQ